MTDGPPSTKDNSPPGLETAGLSRRDLALARVDAILADGRAHRPRPSLRAELPVEEEAAPINIDEVRAEAAPPKPARRNKPERAVKRKGLAALHWFFQTLLLLFVLVWVFLLGIFIGRGYLMESAAGRELIAWISEVTGRQSEAPEILETPPEPAARTPEAASPPDAIPAPAIAPLQPPQEEAAGPESAVLKTVVTAAQAIDPETARGGSEEGGQTAVDAVEENERDEAEEDGMFMTPETLAEEEAALPEAEAAAEPETAAAEPEAAEQPEAAEPELVPLSQSGYAVQTTYALNEQAARALIERLKRQGFPAYFYKNSRDQYLVRVGRFANGEEARKARDTLAGLGYKEPYISKLEPGER